MPKMCTPGFQSRGDCLALYAILLLAFPSLCLVRGARACERAMQMAATGEAFMPSSRSVLALLVRHGMNSFTAWWLPSFVLSTAAFAVTTTWFVAIWLLVSILWTSQDAQLSNVLTAALSSVVVFIVLVFASSILKNIVDTVYVCYARDLDNGAVTKADVHEVYAALPKAEGAVIVQPDNAVVYGAAEMEEGAAGPGQGSGEQPLLDVQ